jgi:branched-chain amino acid transport system ATP-binding protein
MEDRLVLEGITFRYRGNVALEEVSLEVAAGERVAVIGPNGAGKSTLFGVMSGERRPVRGRVYLYGRDVTHLPAHERTRLGLARAFQVARVFPSLTVRENLRLATLAARRRDHVFWREPLAAGAEEAVDGLLEATGLTPLAPRPAQSLSQGDKKRLEIAMALGLGARWLLLDEPTAGMSPQETVATVDLIRRLWQRGDLTVVLTEHDMDVVFGLAQRVVVLARGRLLAQGPPEEIRQHPGVREAYLGRSYDGSPA